MTLANWVVGLGLLAIATVLIYRFTVGDFAGEECICSTCPGVSSHS